MSSIQIKNFRWKKKPVESTWCCFCCEASSNHHVRDGKADIKCSECQSNKHTTTLHLDSPNNPVICSKEQGDTQPHGKEASNFTTTCTEVCGSASGSKSCSKRCLANVYSRDRPNNKIKAYAIIDDQSNCPLGTPWLFELKLEKGSKTAWCLFYTVVGEKNGCS